MQNIDYLKIFRDAWKITWKNRFLWWFGLLTFTSGFLNFYHSPKENEEAQKEWQALAKEINWQQLLTNHKELIIAFFIFLAVLLLIISILSVISKGALIKSTQRILKNEPRGFASGFQDGKKYFWRILSIVFFTGLIISLLFFIFITPVMFLFAAKSYVIGGVLAFFAAIILIPLLVLCNYLRIYALFYVVLADLKIWVAIENAYALFRKNILPSIIMSLLFIPLGLFSLFIVLAIALIVVLIFGLIGLVLFFAFETIGIIIAITGGIVLLISALMLFCSIFKTFSEVTWILFFHIIATPKEAEKVIEEIATEEKASTLPSAEAMKTAETEE